LKIQIFVLPSANRYPPGGVAQAENSELKHDKSRISGKIRRHGVERPAAC
jgi:hypothetical protein